MIERYTLPEMGKIWSLENEWRTILNVELAACDAMAELGEIPAEAAKNIRAKANFTVERIKEIEAVTDHDIIAFLTNVAEYVGDDSKYVHRGLTSSDVKDTAICLMMKQSAEIILDDLRAFREVLRRRAKEFKHTPCIGRTHGIHAGELFLRQGISDNRSLSKWDYFVCSSSKRFYSRRRSERHGYIINRG